MSPKPATRGRVAGGFPRVSGDEPPYVSRAVDGIGFSPRERG